MLQEGIKQNEELKARLTNSEDTLGDSLAENFTKITLPPSPSSEKVNSHSTISHSYTHILLSYSHNDCSYTHICHSYSHTRSYTHTH